VAPDAGNGHVERPGHLRARELLAKLTEQWPAAFAGRPRPLKVGIHHDILAAWPGTDPNLLGSALRRHTNRSEYVDGALTAGAPRIDLTGEPCGEVTEAQVEGLKANRIAEARHRHKRLLRRQQEAAALSSGATSEQSTENVEIEG
jgi:sRNA-binding protein